MKFNFAKPFWILLVNPQITLFVVAYLLVVASVIPALLLSKGLVSVALLFLLFLFTAAFFSGWLGFIKEIVLFKETENPEENFKNRFAAIKNFFGFIPVYILPIIVFMVIFFGVEVGLPKILDYFFGSMDEIIFQISSARGGVSEIGDFILALPDAEKSRIFYRSAVALAAFVIYYVFTMFSAPALYFQKTRNPISALKNSIIVAAKKPFHTLGLFCLICSIHIFLLIFERISISLGNLAMFLALIIRIFSSAYFVVLIFSIYEENFCNNGSDSFGENLNIN